MDLARYIEQTLKVRIKKISAISGGDINDASLIECDSGDTFFVKYNALEKGFEMLVAEEEALFEIARTRSISTPQVLVSGKTVEQAFLVLEFIPPSAPSKEFWTTFGQKLAALHRYSNDKFGWNRENFIGSLPQINRWCLQWTDFFAECRILPQLQLAMDRRRLSVADCNDCHRILRKIDEICPLEDPALTHGDLWGGNFLCHQGNIPVLIDPSISFAHREMDIAMTKLFGGFEKNFYDSYQAHYPLTPGFQNRVDIYQLYYLLVHLNLFGASYLNAVRRIVKKYR